MIRYLPIRSGLVFVAFLFSLPAAAGLATFNFPDLDLSSSPGEVRDWARGHRFKRTNTAPEGQEAYARELADGTRLTIAFLPAGRTLKLLTFDQSRIANPASDLRRKAIGRFGIPVRNETLKGGTTRLTYAFEYKEPASRIFLIQPNRMSMTLVTNGYLTGADKARAQARGKALRGTLEAWLAPALWVAAIGAVILAFLRLAPSKVSGPVIGVVFGIFGPIVSILGDAAGRIGAILFGIALLLVALLSSCSVGAGALEHGTSWWWAAPLVLGFGVLLKADDDGDIRHVLIAFGLFLIALVGPILEGFN